MKKIVSFVLAFVMILATVVPLHAVPQIEPSASTRITRDEYNNFGGVRHTSNNATRQIAEGITFVADNNNLNRWYIHVTADVSGSITVAYQISNQHYMRTIEIFGAGRYIIGDSRGQRGLNEIRLGAFESVSGQAPEQPIVPDIQQPQQPGAGECSQITRDEYNTFGGVRHTSNNATRPIADGITFVADNNNLNSWYIYVTADVAGSITVAYQIGSRHYTCTIAISGPGRHIIGDSRGPNGLNEIRLGEFVPDTPTQTPPDDGDSSDDNDTENDNDNDAPQETNEPQLFIVTNDRGSVFTDRETYRPGETVMLTIFPDIGYYLTDAHASVGTLQPYGPVAFIFTMPNTDATLTFTFSPAEFDPVRFMYPFTVEEQERVPINTKRDFTEDEIMTSIRQANFRFVRGEIIVIAHSHVEYTQVAELARELGGEIVGFLEVANTYQLHFAGATTEDEMLALKEILRGHEFFLVETFNKVMEFDSYNPYEYYDHEAGGIGSMPFGFEGITPLAEPTRMTPGVHSSQRMFIPDALAWNSEWFLDGRAGGPNWGVEAINAPRAWYHLFDNNMTMHSHVEMVKVGVMDEMFANHADLPGLNQRTFENRIPRSETPTPNVRFPTARSIRHGTHVAGTIGARFNYEQSSIAGVAPNSVLYAYALTSTQVPHSTSMFSYKHGLATLFANDVRLFNVSMGFVDAVPAMAGHTFDIGTHNWRVGVRDSLEAFLRKYYNLGFDFLIVSTAGNGSGRNGQTWIHTGYTTIFGNIEDPAIRNRIIIVGNMGYEHVYFSEHCTETGRIERVAATRFFAYSSSQIGKNADGSRAVDIFAPGYQIESTSFPQTPLATLADIETSRTDMFRLTGTSMAAPHVTGVAAMVWGVASNLSGAEVRRIILDNTRPNMHISVGVSTTEIQSYPILCAASAVEAALTATGTANHRRTHNTVFGLVRLHEDASRETHTLLPAEVVIYRRASQNSTPVRVPNAIGITQQNGEWVLTPNPTPIATQFVDGRNVFEITLRRDYEYMLQVSNIAGQSIGRTTWLNFANNIEFQTIVLYPRGAFGVNGGLGFPSTYPTDITITVNDAKVASHQITHLAPTAFMENDRLMAPIRPLAIYMGFRVYWRESTREAVLYHHSNDVRIVMPIDGTTYRAYNLTNSTVAVYQFYDNTPPQIINDMAFLPVAATVRASGMFDAEWIAATNTASITPRPAFAAFEAAFIDDLLLAEYQAGPVEWR